jgi:hypothetical protein
MLVSVQDYLDDRFVVRPNIKAPEELKGKRIGISRFGAASHMRVLNLLPRFGLSEKDVTFLQIGDTPARVVALVGNSIDASSFSPPDHLAATQAGMKILFNMRDFNIAYQGTGLVTTQKFVAQPRYRAPVRQELRRGDPRDQTNPAQQVRAGEVRKTSNEKSWRKRIKRSRDRRPKPIPRGRFKTIFKDVSDRIPAARPSAKNSWTPACSVAIWLHRRALPLAASE